MEEIDTYGAVCLLRNVDLVKLLSCMYIFEGGAYNVRREENVRPFLQINSFTVLVYINVFAHPWIRVDMHLSNGISVCRHCYERS